MTIKLSTHKFEILLLAISTGLFLGIVLFIYQGYNISPGVSSSGHNLLIRSLSFAVLTGTTFFVTELLYDRSSIKFQLIWLRILQTWLAATMVFILYNYFWQWTDFRIYSYLKLLAEFCH